MRLRRPLALAMATALAVGLWAGGASAAPKPGTVTGTVDRSTGPLAKKLTAGVVATPLFKGASVAGQRVTANRRYSLKLAPGFWLVTANTWGRRGPVESAELVQVKAGKRRAVALQATPTAVIMSVGKIMDPTNTWDISQVVDVEMAEAADNAPCDYIVAVDRQGRGYQEVLKELRLNTTEYFPAEVRSAARKALASQAGTRPQYRLEGKFTALSEQLRGTTSGEFRLVDTKTGRTIWKDTISTRDGGSRTVGQLLAGAVSKAICGAPIAFSGNIKSTVTVDGADSTWTVNLAAVFVLSDGGEKPNFYELVYDIASLSGTVTYHATDAQGCIVDATYDGSAFTINNGSVTLRVFPDGRRTYHLNGGVGTPPVPATFRCPNGGSTINIPLATGYLSDENAPWTGPTLAGTYAGPWNNPLAGFTGQTGFQMTASWTLEGQAEAP